MKYLFNFKNKKEYIFTVNDYKINYKYNYEKISNNNKKFKWILMEATSF